MSQVLSINFNHDIVFECLYKKVSIVGLDANLAIYIAVLGASGYFTALVKTYEIIA